MFRYILQILMIGALLASVPSCENYADPARPIHLPLLTPTPIDILTTPVEWQPLDIGRLSIIGPTDLKNMKIQGIDSEVHFFENHEFSVNTEIGLYSCVDGKLGESFVETSKGSIIIDGRAVEYEKTDSNKPLPTAARNADGSTSKPVEKHLSVSACITADNALVQIGYANESSTQLALTILQSVRLKQENN